MVIIKLENIVKASSESTYVRPRCKNTSAIPITMGYWATYIYNGTIWKVNIIYNRYTLKLSMSKAKSFLLYVSFFHYYSHISRVFIIILCSVQVYKCTISSKRAYYLQSYKCRSPNRSDRGVIMRCVLL